MLGVNKALPTGQKHLIKCRCVLPQFKHMQNPPVHQFAVFSVINDDDSVTHKHAQCPNCGVIHKVTEIGRSEIIQGKETMFSLMTPEDLKVSLPSKLVSILENNGVDLPTWEYAKFIYENKQWGNFIVLNTDTDGSIKHTKYLRILGKSIFKIETSSREEEVKNEP